MAAAGAPFVWSAAARRTVDMLVAMQAMHMCATQVLVLASEGLMPSIFNALLAQCLAE